MRQLSQPPLSCFSQGSRDSGGGKLILLAASKLAGNTWGDQQGEGTHLLPLLLLSLVESGSSCSCSLQPWLWRWGFLHSCSLKSWMEQSRSVSGIPLPPGQSGTETAAGRPLLSATRGLSREGRGKVLLIRDGKGGGAEIVGFLAVPRT